MESSVSTIGVILISLSLISKILLAAVFGVAGIAKFLDIKGNEQAMKVFGLPDVLIKPFTFILPAMELFFAFLLLTNFRWYGALGVTLLLVLFLAGMLYQVSEGNAPDCHCFGRLYSEPVGYSSIIRNAVLLIPALYLLAR